MIAMWLAWSVTERIRWSAARLVGVEVISRGEACRRRPDRRGRCDRRLRDRSHGVALAAWASRRPPAAPTGGVPEAATPPSVACGGSTSVVSHEAPRSYTGIPLLAAERPGSHRLDPRRRCRPRRRPRLRRHVAALPARPRPHRSGPLRGHLDGRGRRSTWPGGSPPSGRAVAADGALHLGARPAGGARRHPGALCRVAGHPPSAAREMVLLRRRAVESRAGDACARTCSTGTACRGRPAGHRRRPA